MDKDDFKVGDNVVIFERYGKEYRKTKVSSVDSYSVGFENGKSYSFWNINSDGRQVINVSDIDAELYERMVLTTILGNVLHWRMRGKALSDKCLGVLKKELFGDEGMSCEEVFAQDDVKSLISMGASAPESKTRLRVLESLNEK